MAASAGESSGNLEGIPVSNTTERSIMQAMFSSQNNSDLPIQAAAKPFWCAVCVQGFLNVTELKEHASKHTATQGVKRRRPANSGQQRIRASQACNACAEAKVKCDDESVCRRCQKRMQACVRGSKVDASSLEPTNVALAATATSTKTTTISSSGASPRPLLPTLDDGSGSSSNSMKEAHSSEDLSTLMDSSTSVQHRQAAHDNFRMSPNSEQSFIESRPSTMPGVTPSLSATNITTMDDPRRNTSDIFLDNSIFDFGNGAELALNTTDLDFLEFWTSSFATPQPRNEEPKPGLENINIRYDDSTTHNALKESLGRWTPIKKNYMADECDHLIISPAATEQLNSPAVREDFPAWRNQTLPTIMRDKIIIIIAEICKDGEVLREISPFPSAELLSTLMWDFLTTQHAQDDSWIHMPSFKASEASVELILACIASGAILRPDVAVRKFGFALQEVLTFQIRRVLERSNVLTRDLQSAQAFAIDLQMGQWSGNKRKMERSTSFLPILLNLLRAAGRYRQASYHDIVPLAEDSRPELDVKWRQWIRQESFKRLVFLMYVQATQGSFTSATPPSISYSELSLPLPQAKDLWLATSPEEWKRSFLELHSGEQVPRLSLIDCLREPSKTAILHPLYDPVFSQLVTLYAVSSLIQQYRQSHSVFSLLKEPNARASLLVEEVQRSQLLEVLKTCHYGYDDRQDSHFPSHLVILSLLHMHLYVSMEQLELVAGREGLAEAQAAYPSVNTWIQTQDARQAICHAGEIISIFPRLCRESLPIFHAIALYHATLCIWLYGILSNESEIRRDDTAKSTAPFLEVQIDSTEIVNTQRWVRLGRGTPTIPSFSFNTDVTCVSRILISESSAILSNTRKILNDKFQGEAGSVPPVVESILRALEILGNTGLILRVRY